MNRIDSLFKNKKNNILSIYFTSGFPALEDTVKIIYQLQNSGVDIVEIGIPFSDPLADGPVIQHSNEVSLQNGMTLKLLFRQLQNIREAITIPLILMSYINPVLQFGIEAFCKAAEESGIDGVIIPDLPMKNYVEEYKSAFEKYNLHFIFLITPQTSEERVKLIDENSKGFIYMVSSASITGTKPDISEDQKKYFERIQKMKLKNPTLIGFGISNNKTFTQACEYANGAIIGSAFVKAIEQSKILDTGISNFINEIKNIQQ